MNEIDHDDAIAHCVSKIRDLAALDEPDRAGLLQLGYNLGRLSELTGLGRGPFWARWKGPVAAWDRPALQELVRELHQLTCHPRSAAPPESPEPRRPGEPPPGTLLVD